MRRWDWDRIFAILLILPSVLAIAVFVYGFIGFTGYVSLTRWNKLLPDFTWVGLRNYQTLFAHPRFQIDIRNTVVFTVLFLAASLAIGFFLAVLLDQRVKGENFFRSVYLFPMAISFVVTGVVWRWLLNPGSPEMGSTGVNLLLEHMGLGFLKWGWFTDPTVLYIHPDTDAGMFLQRIGLGFLTTDKFGISVAMISLVVRSRSGADQASLLTSPRIVASYSLRSRKSLSRLSKSTALMEPPAAGSGFVGDLLPRLASTVSTDWSTILSGCSLVT